MPVSFRRPLLDQLRARPTRYSPPRTCRTAHRQLQLSAVNASSSAYGLFVLHERFFERIQLTDEDVECQIHIRVRCMPHHPDRPRSAADARVDAPLHLCARRTRRAGTPRDPHRVRARYACSAHPGVQKRHRLTYEDRPGLYPSIDAHPPFGLSVRPATAKEWMEHFMNSGKTGECSLHCTPHACTMHSRLDAPPDPKEHVRNSIQSEVRLPLAEMLEYDVTDECTVQFSLWEFRAAIHVAEQLGSSVSLAFGYGGDPLFRRPTSYLCRRALRRNAPRAASPPVPVAADATRSSDDEDLLGAQRVKVEATPAASHHPPSQVPLSQLLVQPTPIGAGGNRDEHPSALFFSSPSPPPSTQDDALPPTQPHGARKKFRPLF
ncbi:hypothetical protein CBS14141_000851 [Malassezia furfur]|nr:hypothetical protein CBS14141_000851 [Malassezia furfur]